MTGGFEVDEELEADVAAIDKSRVTQVLSRAADIVQERKVSALVAITEACDEIGGRGSRSTALHTACLDAVCLDIFGCRQGYNASVSRWERGLRKAGGTGSNVIFHLRRIAKAQTTPKSLRWFQPNPH